MGVISRETLKFLAEVRDNYPLTYEYAKSVARTLSVPMGQVFRDYSALIKVMVEKEKEKDGN